MKKSNSVHENTQNRYRQSPVHLPVGKDTLARHCEKAVAFEKEIAEWHDVITGTDLTDS